MKYGSIQLSVTFHLFTYHSTLNMKPGEQQGHLSMRDIAFVKSVQKY